MTFETIFDNWKDSPGDSQWVKGGVRNFFCRWGQRAHFSQLSRCPGPRSTYRTQNLSNLGPPGPKNGPKTAQIGQNGDLKALVVPNGWNSVFQNAIPFD